MQQLAAAPSAALAAACCREVHQRLPALALLPAPTRQAVLAQLMETASRHAAVSHVANLAASLLLHRDPSVRQAALEAAGRLDQSAAAPLLCSQPVAGSLVLALGDAPPRQQLAASLLQAVAHAAATQCGQAFQPWEAWLHCHAGQPVGGPAVAALMQAVAASKCSTWQHVMPLLLTLFHSNPAAAHAAATELHSLLVQYRPAAAGAMLFCPLPFDGLLQPAGSPLGRAGSSCTGLGTTAATIAAKLFTAADVQSLLSIAGNAGLPAELVAAALGQLAQVAGDTRFGAILKSEQGESEQYEACANLLHRLTTFVCLSAIYPQLNQLMQMFGALARAVVLSMLLGHATDASPLHRVQQPALECLNALLEQQPAAAKWLLAEPEGRLMPLLPLVFHPLPASREAVGRLLHHLLFAAASRQLSDLMAGIQHSEGAGSNSDFSARHLGQGVPEPFCAIFCFPVPAAVLPVWPEAQLSVGGSGSSSSSILDAFRGSKPIQQLWQAQQLCDAAADGSAGSTSLLEVLASHSAASLPRWQLDLVRSSLATLRNLQPAAAASEALAALASSQDHAQCQAALHRLALVALPAAMPEVRLLKGVHGRSMPSRWLLLLIALGSFQNLPSDSSAAQWLQGLAALAAAPWLDSLRFFLSSAPLSAEDCCLWLELLPLLPRLMEAVDGQESSGKPMAPQLQAVAEQFLGGSALAWVQQQAGQAQTSHVEAALLPEVLHTVRRLVMLGMRRGSRAQRQHLLAVMRSSDWLELLPKQLMSSSYASRVAALRLAAALLGSYAGCMPAGLLEGQLFTATVRQALMPRHLWGTQHHHGKAAVLTALELLHLLTQALPTQAWAAAWAELGTTYWLSRAAADSSPAVRTAAMRLLAAAMAAPATYALLQGAWPECAATLVDAALAADEERVAARAPALSAIAALLSHGPSHHKLGSACKAATAPAQESAAVHTDVEGSAAALPADPQHGAQAGAASQGASAAIELESEDGAADGSLQLTLLPAPASPLSVEAFLQQDKLWDGVHAVLQVRPRKSFEKENTFLSLRWNLADAFNCSTER